MYSIRDALHDVLKDETTLSDKEISRIEGLVLELELSHQSTPVMWIMERAGCAPTVTHYASVAEHAAERGFIVTPWHSRVA